MDERDAAYRDAADLCARLRERGDLLSLEAAAMIEGTLDAFAAVVDARQDAEEACANLRSNLNHMHRLWDRVPDEHRMRAAHGR